MEHVQFMSSMLALTLFINVVAELNYINYKWGANIKWVEGDRAIT